MTISISETMDANTLGATTSAMTLTGETVITLYVVDSTGSHKDHEIEMQLSPDASGDIWMSCGVIVGIGVLSRTISASRVRARVAYAEGSQSSALVYISAS